jgi:hypothetical protein
MFRHLQFNRLCSCVLVVLMSLITSRAQEPSSGSTLHLYDNFDSAFLNPLKWYSPWQCGSPVMECVREIREDALRLRVRAYGATDSSTGTQFGSSGVSLTAANVTDIAAQLVVRRSSADSCSSNPGFGGGGGHAQVLLFGAFFNGGGGTSADDVQAFLQLDRYATYPVGTVSVGGFLRFQNQFFDNVEMGLVNIGERVTVELLWDQPNHRFVVRLFRPSYGTTTEQYMPYTMSDISPAASPFKNLSANVYPANCQGTRTSADVDVAFDSVMTN